MNRDDINQAADDPVMRDLDRQLYQTLVDDTVGQDRDAAYRAVLNAALRDIRSDLERNGRE